MSSIKKCVAIHDLSGVGRCSLTVAMPVLSVMGVSTCVLPAAYLSTHTAYPGFTFFDLTDMLRPSIAHWKELGLEMDAVYSGFLGSQEQMNIVAECIETFRRPGLLAVIDPVMGDHGKPYKTYTPEMCAAMRGLIEKADIITPNFTEASLLLGRDYNDAPTDKDGVYEWMDALSNGKRSVVITGVRPEEDRVGCAYLDIKTGQRDILYFPFVGQQYHGTGDLFASVFVGSLLNGKDMPQAVTRAATFVHDCAKLTWAEKTSSHEGVRFEALLGRLGQ